MIIIDKIFIGKLIAKCAELNTIACWNLIIDFGKTTAETTGYNYLRQTSCKKQLNYLEGT